MAASFEDGRKCISQYTDIWKLYDDCRKGGKMTYITGIFFFFNFNHLLKIASDHFSYLLKLIMNLLINSLYISLIRKLN